MSNASSELSTVALTSGELLIGKSSGFPATATLTGTTNEIIVTNGSGTITLSTPQAIAQTSSPTFTGMSLTGLIDSILCTGGSGNIASMSLTPTNGITASFGGAALSIGNSQNLATTGNPIFANLGVTGPSFYYSNINTAYTTSTTILVSDLLSRFIQFTAATAGITLTFPTGAAIDTGVSAYITPFIGLSFDFLFWNYNTNPVSFAANTGINFQIMRSTAGSTATLYRMVRVSVNGYYVYNLS